MTRYIAALAVSMTFLWACQRQEAPGDGEPEVPSAPVTSVIPYSCTVSEGEDTKVSLDGNKKYIFETGDRLFVRCEVEDELKMYGVLALDRFVDAEKHFAVFSGDLTCVENFTPDRNSLLSVTLVSGNDRIHKPDSENGQLLQSARSYTGLGEFAATLSQAVQRYSDFTATGHYIDKAFTLYQQSAFLQFSLVFDPEEVAAGSEKKLSFRDAEGNELNSASLAAANVSGQIQINFVTALPADTNVRGYQLAVVEEGGSSFSISRDADYLLSANNYYTVARSLVESNAFTITAEEAETTIKFNYTASSAGIQYSLDSGMTWWDYGGTEIVLGAGENVQFRGTGTKYSSARLFTSSGPCTVSGELRSLLMQSGYVKYQTKVPADAFKQAFQGNTSITGGSLILPDMPLGGNSCYESLFNGCTGLTSCPVSELPATELTSYCYKYMFNGCTNMAGAGPSFVAEITSVPEQGCYGMFQDCTKLVSVGGLFTGTVGKQGMSQMFNACRALTSSPVLGKEDAPITSVGESSCYQMFRYCTALTEVEGVFRLASGPVKGSFQEMFCMSSKPGDEGNDNYQNNVLASVPDFGEFVSVAVASCYSMFIGCKSVTQVRIKLSDSDLSDASQCYIRMFDGCYKLEQFTDCAQYTCLALPAETLSLECYRAMFRNCKSLAVGPDLPAETLAVRCYNKMFDGCTALTTAPTIAATTLADGCCSIMFWGCTSLTTAPVLKAAELVSSCYNQMFESCSHLQEVTCLATSGINASNSTKDWMKGVSSSGTFTRAAEIVWPRGNNGIPSDWSVTDYSQ